MWYTRFRGVPYFWHTIALVDSCSKIGSYENSLVMSFLPEKKAAWRHQCRQIGLPGRNAGIETGMVDGVDFG